jgi:hypothetical protein
MGLAEDSRKVERIVAGSYDAFTQLYLPLLQVGRPVYWLETVVVLPVHCQVGVDGSAAENHGVIAGKV